MPRIRSLLLTGFALGTAACAPAVPWLVTTETVWHDNITNAERSADVLPALQGRTELHGTLFSRALEEGHRLRLTAGGLAEIWPRFGGLNRFATHFAAGLEYKHWLGPYRQVIAAHLFPVLDLAGKDIRKLVNGQLGNRIRRMRHYCQPV